MPVEVGMEKLESSLNTLQNELIKLLQAQKVVAKRTHLLAATLCVLVGLVVFLTLAL